MHIWNFVLSCTQYNCTTADMFYMCVLRQLFLGVKGCIQKIPGKHGVMRVNVDRCQYGLVSHGASILGAVRKTIGFTINVLCIVDRLKRNCHNKIVKGQHFDWSGLT